MPGTRLSDLLGGDGGISDKQFAEDVWGREALLVRASRQLSDRWQHLLSVEDVDEILGRRGLRAPFVRLVKDGDPLPPAQYTAPGGLGAGIGDQVDTDKVLAAWRAGATIVLQGLHRTWPPLVDLANDLVDALGHPVQVNAYLTPEQSRGFGAHADAHDVFVLQVSGRKHWTVRRPGTDGRVEIDHELEPGDTLYLPRGWTHSAAAEASRSLHITVGIHAYDGGALVDAVLAETRDALRARFADELARSLPTKVLDAGVHDEVATWRARTLEVVTDLDATEIRHRMMQRLLDEAKAAPVAPLRQSDATQETATGPVVRRRGLVADVETVDGTVRLRTNVGDLELPADHEQALRRVLEGRPIDASQLTSLPAEQAHQLVRLLLERGLVVPGVPQRLDTR